MEGYKCPGGFSCLNINLNGTDIMFAAGVGAEYSSIFKAFVSNMSFLTGRGWPLVFFGIAEAKSLHTAFFVLCIIFVSALLVVNMFPSIFLSSLKEGEERRRMLKWLILYPGNKWTVTEYEVMIWASQNRALVNSSKLHSGNNVVKFFYKIFLFFIPAQLKRKKKKKNDLAALEEESKAADESMDDDDDDDDDEPLFEEETDAEEAERAAKLLKMDPVDAAEEEAKRISCVPRCVPFVKLRKMIYNESSLYSQFILFCIITNILSLALDSELFPKDVQYAAEILNIFFICIFLLEFIFKIVVMGPVLYFDNPYTIFDFILVMTSLPTLFNNSTFKFINNLRVLRVLRFARVLRLARIYRVVRNVYNTRERNVHSTTITPGRLLGMIMDFTTPMVNVVIFNFLAMFIFTCLGRDFFVDADDAPYVYEDIIEQSVPAAPILDIRKFWGQRYTHEMNFNNFGNAFVTVFNISVLNNWYPLLVRAIRGTSTFSFIYYFSLLFLLYFVPQSTLLASVLNVIEGEAKQKLVDIANDNRYVVGRVGTLQLRSQTRKVFKIWYRNSLTSEGESMVGAEKQAAKQARPGVDDSYDPDPRGDFISEFIKKREGHSLFLFSPRSLVRAWCRTLLKTVIFNLIVLLTVCASVIVPLTSKRDLSVYPPEWITVIHACNAFFFFEMLLRCISTGFYGKGGYLSNPINILDFCVNGIIIANYPLEITLIVNQARLFRLLKLPVVMENLFRSQSLKNSLSALHASMGSVLSVLLATSCLAVFFAILGTQLWSMMYGYCNYDKYPKAMGRYESSAEFPNGCSGYYIDPETNEEILLHWKVAIDSFDSIFTASRTTLRVITSNEWQGIMYSALNCVGKDINPAPYHNRAAFLFFVLLAIASNTFLFIAVGVIYYHYYIDTLLNSQKLMFGEDQAFWSAYEVRSCRLTVYV